MSRYIRVHIYCEQTGAWCHESSAEMLRIDPISMQHVTCGRMDYTRRQAAGSVRKHHLPPGPWAIHEAGMHVRTCVRTCVCDAASLLSGTLSVHCKTSTAGYTAVGLDARSIARIRCRPRSSHRGTISQPGGDTSCCAAFPGSSSNPLIRPSFCWPTVQCNMSNRDTVVKNAPPGLGVTGGDAEYNGVAGTICLA